MTVEVEFVSRRRPDDLLLSKFLTLGMTRATIPTPLITLNSLRLLHHLGDHVAAS